MKNRELLLKRVSSLLPVIKKQVWNKKTGEYRDTEQTDDLAQLILSYVCEEYTKKGRATEYGIRTSYRKFMRMFNRKRSSVKSSVDNLVRRGLIERTFRTVELEDGIVAGNVMFLKPRVEVISRFIGCPVKTGFEFDEIVGGFFPGELCFIISSPADIGPIVRIHFAVNLLYQCAKMGYGCLFFSLERPAFWIGVRLISLDSGIRSSKIRLGELTAQEQEIVTESLDKLKALPIFVDEGVTVTPMDIRSRIIKIKSKHPLHLVLIDSLQLVRTPEKERYNRQAEMADVVVFLKNIATELNIPIIALSDDSDIRAEQTADVVMLIYRDMCLSFGETKLAIMKNNHGRTGISKLSLK